MEAIGPKVFVSSTFYDLKLIRSGLEDFISNLGFSSTLFEKGDIFYDPKRPLESSCYDDIDTSDIYVLLIGGNYGSLSSFDKESSITKMEFERAKNKQLPTYILIDKAVHNYYRIYLENKELENITYPKGVDKRVFQFIEEIYELPYNNPIHSFESIHDIMTWLKKQWAGYFRFLISVCI